MCLWRPANDTKKIDHDNDPLNVMRDIIKKFTPADIPDLPPVLERYHRLLCL